MRNLSSNKLCSFFSRKDKVPVGYKDATFHRYLYGIFNEDISLCSEAYGVRFEKVP